jgi:ribulose-phosphate 3-epimerase
MKLPPDGTIEIAPSILSADFSRLAEHIAMVEPFVKILHLDIMDGHFVPNLSFGPAIVKAIRPHSKLFFDTHLMITDPVKYAGPFIDAGADGITFHLEISDDPAAIIRHIRKLGAAVGISIKPKTPTEALAPVIADVDMVLLMSVEPGFGGQSFIANSPQRAVEIRKMLRPDQRLEIDGGIDTTTAPIVTAAGVDTLVAGNSVFGKGDPAAAVQAILNASRC